MMVQILILTILLPLLLAEFGECSPWLARRVLRWTARHLGSGEAAQRYSEQWEADLETVPGKSSKLVFALGHLIHLPMMRRELGLKSDAYSGTPRDGLLSAGGELHARGFRALLSDEQWSNLVKRGSTSTLRRGTRLLQQGTATEMVYVLRSGRASVVYTEVSGVEITISFCGPGDLFGEYAHVDKIEHVASIWALEDCDVTAIEAKRFERFLRCKHNKELLSRYILSKARRSSHRIWQAANLSTEPRLAQLLLELVEADPSGTLKLPLNRSDIASSLGVSMSSVQRILFGLKEKGVIAFENPGLIVLLDLAALRRIAKGPVGE